MASARAQPPDGLRCSLVTLKDMNAMKNPVSRISIYKDCAKYQPGSKILRRTSSRQEAWRRSLLWLGLSLGSSPLWATGMPVPSPSSLQACSLLSNDAQRLACYDSLARPRATPAVATRADPAASAGTPGDTGPAAPHGERLAIFTRDTELPRRPAPEQHRSRLDSRWELSPQSKLGTFNIRGYQPIYVLPVFATSHQNSKPGSPNPANQVLTPQILDNVEAKFQLSLKTKVWQGIFGDYGDLWFGYTQSSRWQVYNGRNSRPFRETNYEPEALFVFATHYRIFGWDGRMVSFGLNHQSNGRADPLSRSWNRVIANVGFERGDWIVMFTPWWRIPEPRKTDDNPDISNYMGRAQIQIIREWGRNEISLTLRSSMRGGSDAHGSGRLTWSFPLAGRLHGYVELFKGTGESMIDYNHNATYLGAGVSLLNWY